MSSSIRLTNSGAPATPPPGYARIFLEDFNGRLHLKMIRPDGSIQVFGTIDPVLPIIQGGTGVSDIPGIGQFLIGTGDGYRVGDIVAGPGVNITKTETSFEISTDISNIELQMPSEFNVNEDTFTGQNVFVVTKNDQVQNTVYAAPAAGDGTPVFRFLQIEDIPELPIDKITNLIETIQQNSLLLPTDTDDIDHTYDSTTKVLTSVIKPTNVVSGSYGTATTIPSFTVKPDGRLDFSANVDIAIPSTQITDFTEATQDLVGSLVVNSDSINTEYNDFENTLKFHINEEYLITTNISDTENVKAPTSQAIKTYVDEQNAAQTQLIDARFDEVELAIENGVEAQVAAASAETNRVNSELERVYNAITAHRDVINLTPEMLEQQIPLEAEFLEDIMPNSVVAFVDRLGLFEDLDFILSDGPNDKVVLNFTPDVLTILDGTEILRISYLTKI
jgi:hypothetical protein